MYEKVYIAKMFILVLLFKFDDFMEAVLML